LRDFKKLFNKKSGSCFFTKFESTKMSDEDIDMYEDEEVQEEGGEEGVELETKYYDAKGSTNLQDHVK
jgi:hypothetical protein